LNTKASYAKKLGESYMKQNGIVKDMKHMELGEGKRYIDKVKEYKREQETIMMKKKELKAILDSYF
jgi:hypothetical protein